MFVEYRSDINTTEKGQECVQGKYPSDFAFIKCNQLVLTYISLKGCDCIGDPQCSKSVASLANHTTSGLRGVQAIRAAPRTDDNQPCVHTTFWEVLVHLVFIMMLCPDQVGLVLYDNH